MNRVLYGGVDQFVHRFFVISLLLIFGAGCTKAPKDRVVGVWKIERPGATLIATFRANGSFVYTAADEKQSFDQYGGWAMKEPGVIVITTEDGHSARWAVISLGKAEMIVRPGEGGSEILSFKLVSDSPLPESDSEKNARTPEGQKQRRDAWLGPMIDKSVRNNARQLSAAADQYFLENGVTSVRVTDLVGMTAYIKAINTVANETYPVAYTQGVTITVSGVAGTRTITYAP